MKVRHADPYWPGKDYSKLEELNVELGETSGYETNSGDYSRLVVAYLDEAVARLGKRLSER